MDLHGQMDAAFEAWLATKPAAMQATIRDSMKRSESNSHEAFTAGWAAAELALQADAEIERLRAALKRIARWHGEFPPSGRKWDDKTPMSYGAAFGSNGERDFMRQVALDALAAPLKPV